MSHQESLSCLSGELDGAGDSRTENLVRRVKIQLSVTDLVTGRHGQAAQDLHPQQGQRRRHRRHEQQQRPRRPRRVGLEGHRNTGKDREIRCCRFFNFEGQYRVALKNGWETFC